MPYLIVTLRAEQKMGMGRKKSLRKMNRKKSQAKLKARIKRRIENAKKAS